MLVIKQQKIRIVKQDTPTSGSFFLLQFTNHQHVALKHNYIMNLILKLLYAIRNLRKIQIICKCYKNTYYTLFDLKRTFAVLHLDFSNPTDVDNLTLITQNIFKYKKLIKNIEAKKNKLLVSSQKCSFNQNPDYFLRFLVKFLSKNVTFMYFSLVLVFKLRQKLVSQHATKVRGCLMLAQVLITNKQLNKQIFFKAQLALDNHL